MNFYNTYEQLVGYTFLIEKLQLNVIPNWHQSIIGKTSGLHSIAENGFTKTSYPPSYWPGDALGPQLEFALKYDGINLAILASIFDSINEDELTQWIASKFTGKYTRKIWFLFEFITGKQLPLPNLTTGNYVELFEPELYYTIPSNYRAKRQRIIYNGLGTSLFSPIIRRTEKLAAMEKINFKERCETIIKSYSPQLLHRALNYLYQKETKSSFEIEYVTPTKIRTERFVRLLEIAEHQDFCDKTSLIELQNRIVEPRFCETDYRDNQNYVGETIALGKEKIHYICPKPEDVSQLMQGLLETHKMMLKQASLPAIIHAAIISYGFVFIHPFDDGNGRIHRFLIHNILSLRGEIPKGLMFPVSATILKNMLLYDQSLEAFSNSLNPLVEYTLDSMGKMIVNNDTKNWYRYIDMTIQAEALYDFVQLTIEHELTEELDFLSYYDNTKKAIQEIIDMPDRLIDLLIQLCLRNHGHLSNTKRDSHFHFLTDNELEQLEKAIKINYKLQD